MKKKGKWKGSFAGKRKPTAPLAGWQACKDAVTIMRGIYSWEWSAVSAVIDGKIVTEKVPDDLPEFIDAMTEISWQVNIKEFFRRNLEN